MFIALSQWYYHGSTCGYQTKPLLVNADEISSISDVFDNYHNMDGSLIIMKNGTSYNVREDVVTISRIMQAAVEGKRDG